MANKKAVLLLSGGFDSPIAGWRMRQLGYDIIAAHFSLVPLVGKEEEEKVQQLAKKIGCSKLYIFPHGGIQAKVAKQCTHRYYYVITRRLMYRTAESLAQKEGADAIVTGENIGQVGSQTLENMYVISKAVALPIIRPLLTNDKQETIATARDIGTFSISAGPEICSLLGPKHPATRSDLQTIQQEEAKLDVDILVNQPLQEAEIMNISEQ